MKTKHKTCDSFAPFRIKSIELLYRRTKELEDANFHEKSKDYYNTESICLLQAIDIFRFKLVEQLLLQSFRQ